MFFASQVRKTLTDVPGLPGQSVEIRKLGWKALEAAMLERQRAGIAMLRQIGPGGLIKELQDSGGEDAIRAKVAEDLYLRYDRQTLLERGVASWSISEKVTIEALTELDEQVAEFLARQIYELSRPRTEEEQKNG